MFALKDARVAIVGLGLMGGSLGLALRQRGTCRQVWGVARRPETLRQALDMGVIDRGTTDLGEGVRQAELVVLATPVRTVIEQIRQVGPYLSDGCLLTDMGSTKAAIVQAMESLPSWVQPIGGHPMCGKEVAGIEAAEASLYQGAVFVLTPLARTSQEALALTTQLTQAIGARPLVLDAERHDRLVAAISHLPYLLAVSLVGVAEDVAATDELVWQLAASGFRDTSRLAASDLTMMLDILLTNRQAVGALLSQASEELAALARLLSSGDEAALRARLEAARRRRSGWGGQRTAFGVAD